MKAAVRGAVESDIAAILADLRPSDAAEMAALGTTAEDAMRMGLSMSDWAMTGTLDGEPVCMFGVAPQNYLLGFGTPWMLATTRIESSQVAFLRACRPVVQRMLETYPSLSNVVHADNAMAIRWLRWLGFTFHINANGSPATFVVNDEPFHLFAMGS